MAGRAEPPGVEAPEAPGAGSAQIQRRFDPRLRATVATLHPGDYYVAERGELVMTLLGSCVSACVRDARLRRGGMNHFMLPESQPEAGHWGGSAWVATRFGNVAMERLVNEILKLGGRREDLEVKLVGGARVLDTLSDIGARNIQFVRDYVQTEGFRLLGEDLGDLYPRKVLYDPCSGTVRVKRLARSGTLVVAAEERYLTDIGRRPHDGEIELF